MMKVEDFRIGNYIVDYELDPEASVYWKVSEISYIDTNYKSSDKLGVLYRNGSCWNSDPMPVQLTEEILLKINGVEELDYSEWKYLLKISAANLYFRFNAGKCYSQFNDTYLADMISYLHELQNFCHVFKKELNVKL